MKDRLFFVLLPLPSCRVVELRAALFPFEVPYLLKRPCAGLGCQTHGRIQSRKHFRCARRWPRYGRALGNCASPSSFHWLGCRHRRCLPRPPHVALHGHRLRTFYVSHVLGARLYAQPRQLQGDRGSVSRLKMWKPREREGNMSAPLKGRCQEDTKEECLEKLASSLSGLPCLFPPSVGHALCPPFA